MPEAKGRRDANPLRARPRPRPDQPPEDFGQNILDDENSRGRGDNSRARRAPSASPSPRAGNT